MRTPIQELIDSVGNMAQGLDADELYDYFMEKATQMLEKEKEVAQQYAKFAIECDRKELPVLEFDGWINL